MIYLFNGLFTVTLSVFFKEAYTVTDMEFEMINQDRNPSPPPEILENEELLPDRIGDTVYSKRWTIKTLMDIIEFCDKSKINPILPVENTNMNTVEESEEIVELDSKIEEDACMLWDMSASEQVALFLLEHEVCKIFQDVIDKTKSPRLLEIVVGILGNMCTFDHICQSISKNEVLLQTMIFLTGTTDAPSLLQVIRCIVTGLKNKTSEDLWHKAIMNNMEIMNNLKNVLANSLNRQLVRDSCQLLYTILNKDYRFSSLWGEDSFLEALFTAGRLLCRDKGGMDYFFCVFHSLCQYLPNVDEFVERWDDIKRLFYQYILNFKKEDDLFDCDRAVAVSCYFDSFNTLLSSGLIDKDLIEADTEFLRSIGRIYVSVKSLILNSIINERTAESLETKESSELGLEEDQQNKNVEHNVTVMSPEEFETWSFLSQTVADTIAFLLHCVKKDEDREILENLLSFKPTKKNSIVPLL